MVTEGCGSPARAKEGRKESKRAPWRRALGGVYFFSPYFKNQSPSLCGRGPTSECKRERTQMIFCNAT